MAIIKNPQMAGQTTGTAYGTVAFDSTGIARVSDKVAERLTGIPGWDVTMTETTEKAPEITAAPKQAETQSKPENTENAQENAKKPATVDDARETAKQKLFGNTVSNLKAFAETKGISVPSDAKKADIVEAILKWAEAAEGDTTELVSGV